MQNVHGPHIIKIRNTVIYTKIVTGLKKILKLYQDQKIVKIQEVSHIVHVELANLLTTTIMNC